MPGNLLEKSETATNMSHQIRTLMNGRIGNHGLKTRWILRTGCFPARVSFTGKCGRRLFCKGGWSEYPSCAAKIKATAIQKQL